ncbi:MAG: hypothetical protein J7555_03535 [Chloroflexi bacterium]|jgi:hypothetical protein|nr:hypothetical protein [Chloroflexota bacterium]
MFDNLRDDSAFQFEEEVEELLPQEKTAEERPSRPFLGMTPQQRFILSVLLFFAICSMSLLLLLISGRFWLY